MGFSLFVHHRTRLWVSCLALGLALASCNASFGPGNFFDSGTPDLGFDGGQPVVDGGNVDAGMPVALPLNSACALLNARRCEYWTRCGLLDGSEATQRACLAYLNSTWCGPTRWTPRVQASPATLRYDGVKAQACADALLTQSCNLWAQEPASCGTGQMLKANAFPGQACYGGYNECTEGLCKGATCPRTCQPPGAVGSVCNGPQDCSSGLYCFFAPNGVGQCRAYGAVTQPCDSDRPCGSGLTCTQGQCDWLPMAGHACLNGSCDSFSYCVTSPDGGVCLNRKMVNAPCTDDSQCAESLLCDDLSQTCQPARVSMLGERCSLEQTCKVGPACVGATLTTAGSCQAPLSAGAVCLRSSECRAELACGAPLDGGSVKRCRTRLPNGQACSVDRDCQLLSKCHQGVCVALPLPGAPCVETRSCLWGPCEARPDGGAVCIERAGPGYRCTLNSDCSSERCFNGQCLAGCEP